MAAAYLINYTPSSILGGRTPFEVLFEKPATYYHMKVFWVSWLCKKAKVPRKTSLENEQKKCIFIGYPYAKKG